MKRLSVVAFCLFAFTIVAQAPPSFREGVIAFEKKEWANAETALRAAVAANPRESEGTVQLAGSWFETYVPHYFLARALAKQGKCAEALKEFAESERQGVTPAIPDFARHLQTRDGCGTGAKPAKPSRPVTEVTVPFGEDDVPTPAPAPKVVKPVIVPTPVPRPAVDARALAEKTRLASAVTEYLRGHYTEAARLLDPAQFHDRAATEAALFRAASRYALSRIGGEKDEALKRDVALDVQTYRALRGSARPDPRVFPPTFIAMTR